MTPETKSGSGMQKTIQDMATRELLEAALQGYDIKRKEIEAKQAEIREALKSPVEVMAGFQRLSDSVGGEMFADADGNRDFIIPEVPKRKMSAAGRAAISKATKARWAKYRKEQNRA